MVESLWREYFREIAIKERMNPRLQAKLMPRRYWKHLVEMEGERLDPAAARRRMTLLE
jgi:hypothetical protein